mmetsp:Transcript_38397/g.96188  ORF Transcript_38397/g.96188 Transcript_38397/m.96188 type:complete len:198 (-) Transcript_38397:188-781(-)
MYVFLNSGTLGAIVHIRDQTAAEVQTNMEVNLIAPTVICSVLLQWLQQQQPAATATRPVSSCRIVDISSRAATGAYAGFNLYGLCKTGRAMLTKVITAERQDELRGESHGGARVDVKTLSFAPGRMLTGMTLPVVENGCVNQAFTDECRRLHATNGFLDPHVSTSRLMALLDRDEFESGAFVSVGDKRQEWDDMDCP